MVAVTVYDDGAPVAGAPVAFHDGDGVVVDEAQTAADGRASSGAATVAMVTVGTADGTLATVQGVEAGDELVVGVPQPRAARSGQPPSPRPSRCPLPRPTWSRWGRRWHHRRPPRARDR